ncbi:MAG: hypothetical protein M5U12_24960 [Verrucomicrobia bacterium]|nr:hypothetical protein [Verrucomicrobiota bacterium]
MPSSLPIKTTLGGAREGIAPGADEAVEDLPGRQGNGAVAAQNLGPAHVPFAPEPHRTDVHQVEVRVAIIPTAQFPDEPEVLLLETRVGKVRHPMLAVPVPEIDAGATLFFQPGGHVHEGTRAGAHDTERQFLAGPPRARQQVVEPVEVDLAIMRFDLAPVEPEVGAGAGQSLEVGIVIRKPVKRLPAHAGVAQELLALSRHDLHRRCRRVGGLKEDERNECHQTGHQQASGRGFRERGGFHGDGCEPDARGIQAARPPPLRKAAVNRARSRRIATPARPARAARLECGVFQRRFSCPADAPP